MINTVKTIRKKSSIIITIITIISLSLPSGRTNADNGREMFFYHGHYTETDFLPVVLRLKTEYRDSYLAVIGMSFPLDTAIRFFEFETEGNVGIHTGLMSHVEGNALLTARIRRPFSIPVSIAFGEGLSVASQNPNMENREKGMRLGGYSFDVNQSLYILHRREIHPALFTYQLDSVESRPVLNFIMMELEYRFQNLTYEPGLFLRVHHRSGVFGLYCPPDPACGSNFISYGMKWRIP